MAKTLRTQAAIVFFAMLAPSIAAHAQTYSDPIITPPPTTQPPSTGGGGGGSNEPAPPPVGSSETGQITDATGLTTTITLDNKALEFQSAGRRQGAQIHYDAGLDSGQGGGAGGGFPYWEVGGDWAVSTSAYCEVAGRNKMEKVAGTKERDLNCYIAWMAGGGKEYVDRAHCEVGANNEKPDDTMSYLPPSCPHPEWVFSGWSAYAYTNNWYRASGDASKTCGTITEYRDKRRTRTATCKNGSYNDCLTYNGTPTTEQTGQDSRTRDLGSCGETRYDSRNRAVAFGGTTCNIDRCSSSTSGYADLFVVWNGKTVYSGYYYRTNAIPSTVNYSSSGRTLIINSGYVIGSDGARYSFSRSGGGLVSQSKEYAWDDGFQDMWGSDSYFKVTRSK